MSKQLYPQPKPARRKKARTPKEDLTKLPYHVEYSDPSGDLEPEWKHYTSELAVKVDAWFRCKVLGFTPAATLYTRDELKEIKEQGLQ